MALNTLKTIVTNRKERFRVPQRVQDIIPVTAIWEDGIFQHGKNQFSRTYLFSDINYLVAGRDERKSMNYLYRDLLDSLGGGATFKITTNNRSINMSAFEKNTLIEFLGDDQDEYRMEYNQMLLDKIDNADGIMQEKYLTVTVFKSDIDSARTYFNRIFISLQSSFSALGSKLTELDASERLRIFHDFFRPGHEDLFRYDFKDSKRLGYDFRDAICPVRIKPHPNYLKVGDKYVRVLFAADYASYVRDDVISRLTELSRNIMVSVDVITIPKDEAEKEVESRQDKVESNITRWQAKQNQNNNFSANIPYQMKKQRQEIEDFMSDIVDQDQSMHIVTFTLIHMADSLEQLDADTETLMAVHDCKLMKASGQMYDGMATALPFGVCKMEVSRTLLTRVLACVSMPFRVQEIQEPGGIWFGENAMSHNLILCDRSNLLNQGMFITGVPGSGKSMMAKELITFLSLGTKDTILINDPEGEYAPLVKALGGTVFEMYAGGPHHLNLMAMERGYGDDNAVADKVLFLQSVFERMEEGSLTAQEKSLIDRTASNLLLKETEIGLPVTLTNLRELLLNQPEPEAQKLALTLERFTTGSMDCFSHETNVDLSGRILCFDLHRMQKQMRPIGQLAITDLMVNKVDVNYHAGIRTHIFNDEFQEFFTNENSAEFFDFAWRQFRKRGAYPTGITQNVKVLLNHEKASSMLSNSEILIMLNQSAPDREQLSEVFQIPDEQLNYVRDSEPGCGLIRYGGSMIPFVNKFPRSTKLYQLMTTKPEEGYTGGSQ